MAGDGAQAAPRQSSLVFGAQAVRCADLRLVAAVLAIAGLAAGFFPAPRAAGVKPAEALRAD